MLDAADLVGDLWSVPAYLRRCAPWLTRDEVFSLQREEPQVWTTADLPILDAARHRLGDPDVSRNRRRQEAKSDAQREEMAAVIDHLIAADDDREGLAMMLRHPDLRENLVDDDPVARSGFEALTGPFAHIVVDEAQELTDAQWQMLLRRCPSRSLTIVGDRAQARHGFAETWEARLGRVGLHHVDQASLDLNYRTPAEVMDEASSVIRAALPDANVPRSIRTTGVPVIHSNTSRLGDIVDRWLDEHEEGTVCVIGDQTTPGSGRVRSLSPELAKGLEFDFVVVVDPDSFGGWHRGRGRPLRGDDPGNTAARRDRACAGRAHSDWLILTWLPAGSRKAQSRTPHGWSVGSCVTSAPLAWMRSKASSRFGVDRTTVA